MLALSATDVAIRLAIETGSLRVTAETGRYGAYWAISDDHGLIEVALSEDEADQRVKACS